MRRARLGPKNIHVAHLVIGAGVDTAWVHERIKERVRPLANLDPGRLMRPALGRGGLLADLSGAARRLVLRPLAEIRRFYALDDCGTRMNPMIVGGYGKQRSGSD
ncbi:MAG TPA: hypothetical protein VHT00_08330 [Stellaceae bacterium]|nr:hypothetical protein [Stellaceae bacterium]